MTLPTSYPYTSIVLSLTLSQGPRPRLAIVQVGDRNDSNVYINMKRKAGGEIGVAVDHVRISRTVTEGELLEMIDALNSNLAVDGIIVQMPLDCDAKLVRLDCLERKSAIVVMDLGSQTGSSARPSRAADKDYRGIFRGENISYSWKEESRRRNE